MKSKTEIENNAKEIFIKSKAYKEIIKNSKDYLDYLLNLNDKTKYSILKEQVELLKEYKQLAYTHLITIVEEINKTYKEIEVLAKKNNDELYINILEKISKNYEDKKGVLISKNKENKGDDLKKLNQLYKKMLVPDLEPNRLNFEIKRSKLFDEIKLELDSKDLDTMNIKLSHHLEYISSFFNENLTNLNKEEKESFKQIKENFNKNKDIDLKDQKKLLNNFKNISKIFNDLITKEQNLNNRLINDISDRCENKIKEIVSVSEFYNKNHTEQIDISKYKQILKDFQVGLEHKTTKELDELISKLDKEIIPSVNIEIEKIKKNNATYNKIELLQQKDGTEYNNELLVALNDNNNDQNYFKELFNFIYVDKVSENTPIEQIEKLQKVLQQAELRKLLPAIESVLFSIETKRLFLINDLIQDIKKKNKLALDVKNPSYLDKKNAELLDNIEKKINFHAQTASLNMQQKEKLYEEKFLVDILVNETFKHTIDNLYYNAYYAVKNAFSPNQMEYSHLVLINTLRQVILNKNKIDEPKLLNLLSDKTYIKYLLHEDMDNFEFAKDNIALLKVFIEAKDNNIILSKEKLHLIQLITKDIKDIDKIYTDVVINILKETSGFVNNLAIAFSTLNIQPTAESLKFLSSLSDKEKQSMPTIKFYILAMEKFSQQEFKELFNALSEKKIDIKPAHVDLLKEISSSNINITKDNLLKLMQSSVGNAIASAYTIKLTKPIVENIVNFCQDKSEIKFGPNHLRFLASISKLDQIDNKIISKLLSDENIVNLFSDRNTGNITLSSIQIERLNFLKTGFGKPLRILKLEITEKQLIALADDKCFDAIKKQINLSEGSPSLKTDSLSKIVSDFMEATEEDITAYTNYINAAGSNYNDLPNTNLHHYGILKLIQSNPNLKEILQDNENIQGKFILLKRLLSADIHYEGDLNNYVLGESKKIEFFKPAAADSCRNKVLFSARDQIFGNIKNTNPEDIKDMAEVLNEIEKIFLDIEEKFHKGQFEHKPFPINKEEINTFLLNATLIITNPKLNPVQKQQQIESLVVKEFATKPLNIFDMILNAIKNLFERLFFKTTEFSSDPEFSSSKDTVGVDEKKQRGDGEVNTEDTVQKSRKIINKFKEVKEKILEVVEEKVTFKK